MKVKVCTIKKHGLPDMEKLVGRVAFLWDGNIINGWPLYPDHSFDKGEWEGDSDVSRHGTFTGVTTYFIFDKPLWEYEVKEEPPDLQR